MKAAALGAPASVVGVTANRLVDDDVHREWIRRRYVEALEAHAGVTVVVLPTSPGTDGNAPRSLERLDGLVLTGDESDVDQTVFEGCLGAGFDYKRNKRDRYRDRLSRVALRKAFSLGMPILGICRGLQELNVFCGGTLVEDLSSQPTAISHVEDLSLPRDRQYEPVHEIRLEPSGLLARITGRSKIFVNSLHKQGVSSVGERLAVEGVAPDGLVEALRVEDAPTFQLGVQWHPEWHVATDSVSQSIFKAFGAACHDFRASRQR